MVIGKCMSLFSRGIRFESCFHWFSAFDFFKGYMHNTTTGQQGIGKVMMSFGVTGPF